MFLFVLLVFLFFCILRGTGVILKPHIFKSTKNLIMYNFVKYNNSKENKPLINLTIVEILKLANEVSYGDGSIVQLQTFLYKSMHHLSTV